MKKSRLVSILLTALMVINMGMPVSAGVDMPDLTDEGGAALTVQEEPAEDGIEMQAATPTELNISKGNIQITSAGARGGGLADAETELNPDGYRITGSSTTNTIVVKSGAAATIELSDVSIQITDLDSAMTVEAGAEAFVVLTGSNTLTSTDGAGLGLQSGAKVHIDGNGSLEAKCTGTEGYSAGIGAYQDADLSAATLIEINGGVIHAVGGGYGGAGIGGNSTYRGGKIQINGGTITAEGGEDENFNPVFGIGDALSIGNTENRADGPIIINGGSVTGAVQAATQNSAGKAVSPVVVRVPSNTAGEVFTFADGERNWTAKAPASGELRLFLTAEATMLEATAKGNIYNGAISGTGNDRTATLSLYQNDCTCNETTAGADFSGGAVYVNKWLGSNTVSLSASFTKSDACVSENHIPIWTYELVGVDADAAKIEGNKLTVYYGPEDGSGITGFSVKATALVNKNTYSATAEFTVNRTDNLEFDLTRSDIIIDKQGKIQYDGQTLNVTENEPIRIVGDGKVTSHVIEINATRSGDITLDNVRMGITNATSSKARITLGMNVNARIVLVGENSIFCQENKDSKSSITIPMDSTLTIAGSGSLSVEPRNYPAVGDILQVGTLVIEGGKVSLKGGQDYSAMQNIPTTLGTVSQTKGNLILKGGLLSVEAGQNTLEGGTRPKDLNANLVIDGGSIITDQEPADGGFSNTEIQNSAGQVVYPVTMSLEGVGGDQAVSYALLAGRNSEGTEGTAVPTFTDASGFIYTYLPVADGEAWTRIRAWRTAGSDDPADSYYKRIRISDTEDNTAKLRANPQLELKNFNLPMQISLAINGTDVESVMPQAVNLTSLTPTLTMGYGEKLIDAEYFPKGAQDFSNSETTPVEYTIIADNGDEIVYRVKVTRGELIAGQKTELDIGNGDIIMENDGRILYGDQIVESNPYGYIIKGNSNVHHLAIGNITAPIEFNNLTIERPNLSSTAYADKAPLWISGPAITIRLRGINQISGGMGSADAGQPAMFVSAGGSVTFTGPVEDIAPDPDEGGGSGDDTGSGGETGGTQKPQDLTEGILKLTGGLKRTAAAGSGSFVIEGGSIFLTDGTEAPQTGLRPKDSAGNALFALELTLDTGSGSAAGAAGKSVSYSDSVENLVTGVSQPGAENRKILTDSSGRISVYRPSGVYCAAVSLDGRNYYGENQVQVGTKTALGAAESGKGTVRAGSPRLTGLTFKDPVTCFANTLTVVPVGTCLGGGLHCADIVVKATGGVSAQFPDGNVVTGSGIFSKVKDQTTRKDVWQAKADLEIPANADFDSDYVYTLSATVDGVEQTGLSADQLIMKARLAITGFRVSDHQLGDADITLDESGSKGTIVVNMPYDEPFAVKDGKPQEGTFTYTPQITFSPSVQLCTPDAASPRTYTSANNYTIKYTIYATQWYGMEGESEDCVEYSTTVRPQATPVVTGAAFTNPTSYRGGAVEVTLVGENLASIRNALFEPGKKVIVSIKDESGKVIDTQEIRTPDGGWEAGSGSGSDTDEANNGGVWKFTANMPQNDGGQPVEYEIAVNINGVEQTMTGDHKISVPGALEKNAQISGFEFTGVQLGNSVITHNASDADGTIAINVPWTTEMRNLAPTITLVNPLASVSPVSGRPQDFSDSAVTPVVYTVTSYDKTVRKNYNVTVTRVANAQEKDPTIHNFTLPNMIDVTIVHPTTSSAIEGIDEVEGVTTVGAIRVTMPSGTVLTDLAPEITLGHEDAQVIPESGEAQDFTMSEANPIRYRVTSVDGTVYEYDVTVVLRNRRSGGGAVVLPPTPETESQSGTYKAFMKGVGEGLFRPDSNMTRAEAAALFSNLLGYQPGAGGSKNAASGNAPRFADVPADMWYAGCVEFAAAKGLIQGFDGNFRPTDSVTRMEYASMLDKLMELMNAESEKKDQPASKQDNEPQNDAEQKDDDKEDTNIRFTDLDGAWGQEAVLRLAGKKVISGFSDGTFRPNRPITRAEAASMSVNAMKRPNTAEVRAALRKKGSPFIDVTDEHWAYLNILNAVYDYEVVMTRILENREVSTSVSVEIK